MLLKEYLLSQSLAVRTNILPEVEKTISTVVPDYDSVKKYKTDIVKWLKPIIDLSAYSVYPTNGITEGLNWFAGTSKYNIWKNSADYQWIDNVNNRMHPCIHYQSIPSAIDGNFVEPGSYEKLALDLAYIGSTKVQKIKINNNVEYVFYSLSKSFGIRNIRTGWIFTQQPDVKLEGLINSAKYYNYYASDVAETIINNFDIDYVYNRLYTKQKEICNILNFKPSDSVWLATTTDPEYSKFRRKDDIARICLAGVYK